MRNQNQSENHDFFEKLPRWAKGLLLALLLALVVLGSPRQANAQGGPQPFYEFCNGQWHVGPACYGRGGLPSGVQMGQSFGANVDGRQVQMVCDWSDRFVSGVIGAGIGAGIGIASAYIENHTYTNQFGQNVKVANQTARGLTGALAGGAAGATVMCMPMSGEIIHKLIGDEPRRQSLTSSQSITRSESRTVTVNMCRDNRTGSYVGPADDNSSDPCHVYREKERQQTESRVLATYTGSTTYYDLSLQECEDKKGGEYLGKGRCLVDK